MTDPQHPDGYPSPAAPVPPTAPYPSHPAPSGAYQVPSGGYPAPSDGYPTPTVGYPVPEAPEKRPGLLGALSLVLSLIAAIALPVVAAIAAFTMGARVPELLNGANRFDDLSFLAPVRDQVMWAELSFWAATALGVAAFILGIVAIVQRRGRGMGIAAVVVSVIGPGVFAAAALIGMTLGTVAAIPAAAVG